MTTKSNRNTAKGIFRSATATIAAGVMVLSPTLAMADEAIDQGQATGNDIPEQTGGEQPIVQAQAIEDAITQGNDTPSVDEATGTEDAGEAEEVALTVATEPNPEVEQGADDVMSSDIAPTTKDEAAEQLEEAKQETQQASDELADATQGKADAQQALDDEQAREDAIAQDAADKNQAVEDTKQSTEATLDEHIEAGEGIFDNGLPRGRYSEWVDQANQMEDLYSEDDAALVQEANDLRDTVAQERQNELDKAATANGEAEASRQRRDGIQAADVVRNESNNSTVFTQALSLAMGTAWQSTVLDLANETFVPIYEQFLDLAGRIADKDAVVNVFAGADEGELDDATEATERYEWMSYYRTDVAKAQAAYATYQDNWNNGGQLVAGDLPGALALLTDAGLGADSWQTRYVQETNTLFAALARANQATATAAAYASMLGGDDAWTADDRATVSDNPLFVPSMSLNTYHDPDDPTYVYHGMADQADAVLNASEWRSDKLAREFLGGDGAYDAWDQAGRPDLGEAFDAFVATKYAEAHETVAKNVTFDQANPAPSLADLDPNLPNNHLGDLSQAYSDAGTANDLAATNDGTDAEQAALALAEQVRQQAQDKYDAAVLKQAIAQFIYDNWTDPQPDNPQPDNPQPDNPQPDNPQPDNPQPDNPQPDNPQPDNPQPDTPKPDTPKPDKPQPDTPQDTEEDDTKVTNVIPLPKSLLPQTGDDNLEAVSGFLAMAGVASLSLVVLCRRKENGTA